MRIFLLSLSVMFVVCGGALAQTPSTGKPTPTPPPSAFIPNSAERGADKPVQIPEGYVIGTEDVLGINVWREQELSTRVSVRPDGKIGLPLLNDVQASGLTPTQLQEQITGRLKSFINSPQVSVIVLEIHSQNVYIMGNVNKPGVYPLGGPMTIMELLVRAGGLTDFAKEEEIAIVRNEGSKQAQYRFNYKRFAQGRDYQQNIKLRNGDMVIVK